jgi:ribonuclease HI
MSEILVNKGLVLYTDGGIRKDCAGYGVHGYLWQADVDYTPPKKGLGLGGITVTNKGYWTTKSTEHKTDGEDAEESNAVNEKAAETEETLNEFEELAEPEEQVEVSNSGYNKVRGDPVVCTHYLDIVGSMGKRGTNNTAEAVAVLEGLRKARDYNLNFIHVVSDSQYALNGCSDWVYKWESNGYTKPGTDVVIKNADVWKQIKTELDYCNGKNIKLSWEWVKGHAGEWGNERADDLATLGVGISIRNPSVTLTDIQVSDASGYWKDEIGIHPLFNAKQLYFVTGVTNQAGCYFVGNQDKDLDLAGTKNETSAYALIYLDEQIKVVDDLIAHHNSLNASEQVLVAVRLDLLLRPKLFGDLDYYGNHILNAETNWESNRLSTFRNGKKKPEIVTRELKPAGVSARVVSVSNELTQLLERYSKEDSSLQVTEITDKFYEKVMTGKNKTTQKVQLLADVKAATHPVKVQAKYSGYGDDSGVYECTLQLTTGVDLPFRNTLKRLEDFNPQLYLVTWRITETVFQYATIIKTDGATAVWVGHSTNFHYLLNTKGGKA